MNPYGSTNAYRENSILTASPEQLVVMLYDGAGRFLRQAEGSMIDGSWLQASEKLSRAEAIIDELLATLDMDAGEVADRLQSIYVFCKTRLIEAKKFDANNVKVVTERRVVYLMGLVSATEGDAAAEVAAKTSDVARVVKLFEYRS